MFKLWGKLGENEVKIEEISEEIDEEEDLEFSKNYFLIRGRSWIEAAANWTENIFWLEATAINGALHLDVKIDWFLPETIWNSITLFMLILVV